MLSGTVVVPSSPHQGRGIEKGMIPCEDIGRRVLPGVIRSDVPAHRCLTVCHGGYPRLQGVQQCRRLPPRGRQWSSRQRCRVDSREHTIHQSHSRIPTRKVTRIITRAVSSSPALSATTPTPWQSLRYYSPNYGNNKRKSTNYSFCMNNKRY